VHDDEWGLPRATRGEFSPVAPSRAVAMHSGLGVLVVEDEPAIADTLVYALKTEGFAPHWCTTGRAALTALAEKPFAMVVLDVGLPDGSGFDVCKEIRAHSAVPVLFLTARNSELDRVLGLELGGDDYLVKPFSPRELTARVKAILRRTNGGPPLVATAGGATNDFTVDEPRCAIAFRGTELPLTRYEYRLLKTLVSQPGRVFSREQLMMAAWEDPAASLERTVDAHIKTLRAKLRAAAAGADPIQTHRGLGYSLKSVRA
jgi:two-component system catabolic regulation response regulator CreB